MQFFDLLTLKICYILCNPQIWFINNWITKYSSCHKSRDLQFTKGKSFHTRSNIRLYWSYNCIIILPQHMLICYLKVFRYVLCVLLIAARAMHISFVLVSRGQKRKNESGHATLVSCGQTYRLESISVCAGAYNL